MRPRRNWGNVPITKNSSNDRKQKLRCLELWVWILTEAWLTSSHPFLFPSPHALPNTERIWRYILAPLSSHLQPICERFDSCNCTLILDYEVLKTWTPVSNLYVTWKTAERKGTRVSTRPSVVELKGISATFSICSPWTALREDLHLRDSEWVVPAAR